MSEEVSEHITIDLADKLTFYEVGMLGVVVSKEMIGNAGYVRDLRLRMIEARILRIEEAFKRTGFDLNSINLSNI